MTATEVNGVPVVSESEVESPLSSPKKPVTFTRIRLLHLADGGAVYGCTECDHTEARMASVRAHLRRHSSTRRPERKIEPLVTRPAALGSMTLDQIAAGLNSIDALSDALERMTTDRNEWKARALKAERAMATLKRVLA
jgi:hypothetical protein